MAETLLLPVLRGVIGKAADALVKTITRMCGVDDDREKLERHLVYVSRKLADAEVKGETDEAVRTWMKALKAVAYKADDVLDHIQYEALRREAQGHRSTTSKVLSNFTRENPLLFRLKVSRELKDVLHKIDELVGEMNKFSLLEHAEAVPQVSHPQTYSSLDESEEIYGRDDDKAVVVKLLLDQQNQQKVQVLPIIGMGGLGKTTLAKMVYNDIRVQNHFDLQMWHCVSDNFEAQSIVRFVIELATKCKCDLPENIELLWGKLLDVIGRKRFLLVLDDVWNEDECKWEDYLKPLLCSSVGGSGSVIVVTSRSQKVASIMGTFPPHELACLSEEDSWKLFSKKAFSNGVQEREDFIALGRCIVKKCKGLPLALRTMGGLMSSKQGVNEWVAIADSTISDTKRGKDDVMSILKLSYKYLSSEMRQCFAFCAIFPKDYEMEKDELIQLWMANNFIHAEETIDLTQKGEFIFNELVWRSFLEDVKDSGLIYVISPDFSCRHLKVKCKMHDLMHDLAKSATEECAFAEELIKKKASIKCVCHIKMSSAELRKNKGLLKRASSLRTLLIDDKLRYKDTEELKLKSLRALHGTEPSHSLVEYSKYLQYLDLSGSAIVTLPDSVCMMYNLQSLRLDRCYELQYLPEGLATSLRKLRHICLFRCNSLEEMPPNLSLLHNLHTLTVFVVGTKEGCGIEELKDLQHLGNRLELWELRKVKSGSNANLHEKQNLCELVLNWNHPERRGIRTDDDINNGEEILESLVPPSELRVLEVRGYRGLGTSQWMRDPRMFERLRTLVISDWPRCKDIPLIWLSTSLENLYLARMDSITTLFKSIEVEAEGYSNFVQVFPRLKRVNLEGLPNLERWTDDPCSLLMFPQLETLVIAGCQKLATLPEGPLLKRLFCKISSLLSQESYCSKGFVPMSMPLANWPSLVRLEVGMLVNVDVSVEDQQGQSLNPLETLRYLCTRGDDAFTSIFDIPKLQVRLTDCLSHVEEFEISYLYNIGRWPVEELGYMPRLRTLDIWFCTKLGKEGLSSEEILPLPLLEYLCIQSCDALVEIPQLPLSLETLEIGSCRRLVTLPSNLINLAKLRGLILDNCDALKALPDGMDGLTSLEELWIYDCPGIEEFPEGLLRRLPTLKHLYIHGCPALQRRCREGGEYFDQVSSIPKTRIGRAVEPTKRFLPLCGGDSQLSCLRIWD